MCSAPAGAHPQGRQLAKHSQSSGLQQGFRASHTLAICAIYSSKAGSTCEPRLTHTADRQNIIIGVLRYEVAAAIWNIALMPEQQKGHACRHAVMGTRWPAHTAGCY